MRNILIHKALTRPDMDEVRARMVSTIEGLGLDDPLRVKLTDSLKACDEVFLLDQREAFRRAYQTFFRLIRDQRVS